MKVTLQCSVALKHHEGVAFGSALWMDGDRIQFEANARIKDGEICEMRMELRGYKETVYGRVRIGKMIRRGGRPRSSWARSPNWTARTRSDWTAG